MLREAWLHDGLDTCLFLFMEYNGHRYTGSMYFDDIGFCYEIDTVLKSNLGRSIKEIGDLDLAHPVVVVCIIGLGLANRTRSLKYSTDTR